MRPALWPPSVTPSAAEQASSKRSRRAQLLVVLREHRHELFTDTFQEDLAPRSRDSAVGQPPTPPAQLALATSLPASTGVSAEAVMAATTLDRRWHLGRECLDCQEAPCSKGTRVGFRQRLIGQQMDRRRSERPIELAADVGDFGARQWRAALDSSPLWGASRVEAPYQVLGPAPQPGGRHHRAKAWAGADDQCCRSGGEQ